MTTFKSVALQLHEQRCYTVQWDWQQLAKLRPRRTEEDRGEYNKDPDWLIEQALRDKLYGGRVALRYDEKVDKIVAAIVRNSRIKFYFL